MDRKKVLVTGANGFVGERLCRYLVGRGHHVRGAIRQAGHIPARKIETVVAGNIDRRTDWRHLVKDMDVVIHLAARVHAFDKGSPEDIEKYREVNVLGTEKIVEAALDAGVSRFIFASSVKAQAESSNPERPLTEKMVPTPRDPYGASKLAAEKVISSLCSNSETAYTILRLPMVYGPGVKGNMLKLMKLVQKNLPLPFKNVRNRRSLMGLDNLCDLILTCLHHPQAVNKIFLVSDGHDLSTPRLIDYIARAMGRKSRLVPMPFGLLHRAGKFTDSLTGSLLAHGTNISAMLDRLTGSLAIDNSFCCNSLNWQPPVTVEKAIDEMVADFLSLKKTE